MRDVARIYIRLSGRTEQDQVSPEVQKRHCERIALDFDWRQEYYDEGSGLHSAFKRTAVKEWERLYRDATENPETVAVIAYDLSRSFRNSAAFKTQIQNILAAGVRVIFAIEGEVRFDNADDVLVWGFRSEIAEYESRKTTERLRKHYALLRAKRIYTGHHSPPGLIRTGHATDGTLRLVPGANLPLIVEFLKLYLADHGTPSAAQELEKRGLIPSGHWQRWRTTFRRLFAKLEKGYYDGILDADLISRALAEHGRRAKEQRRTRKPRRHPIPALWQLLVCGTCGRKLSTGAARYARDERVYLNYAHPTGDCPAPRNISARKAVKQLKPWLARLRAWPPEHLDAFAMAMAAPPIDDRTGTELAIRKLETRLAGLDLMLADGDITRERFRELKAQTEREIGELNAQRQPIPIGPQWTYAGARVFLQRLVDTDFAELVETDPEGTNRLLRVFLERVELEPKKTLRFVLRPAFAWMDAAPPVPA